MDRASTLCCLIYWSRPRPELLADGLVTLVERAAERNGRDGVSGVLLLNRGYVMQVLEGPEAPVRACFERIRTDPRHNDVTLIALHAIRDRSFANWSMRLLPPLADATPMLSDLFNELVSSRVLNPGHDYALWLMRAHALRAGDRASPAGADGAGG